MRIWAPPFLYCPGIQPHNRHPCRQLSWLLQGPFRLSPSFSHPPVFTGNQTHAAEGRRHEGQGQHRGHEAVVVCRTQSGHAGQQKQLLAHDPQCVSSLPGLLPAQVLFLLGRSADLFGLQLLCLPAAGSGLAVQVLQLQHILLDENRLCPGSASERNAHSIHRNNLRLSGISRLFFNSAAPPLAVRCTASAARSRRFPGTSKVLRKKGFCLAIMAMVVPSGIEPASRDYEPHALTN